MKKIFFILIIIILSSKMFSQTICGKVNYTFVTNIDYNYSENYLMTFNSNESFCEEIDIEFSKDKQKIIDSKKGRTKANIAGRKNLTSKFFYNNLTNLYFRDNFDSKILLVKDNSFNWQWKLHQETKKIGKFVCNKATIKFRGRNYIAWYTNKIPVPFGPWKFQGLPGLILEIYDFNKIFHITTTKVKIEEIDCKIILNKKQLKNALSIKKYLKRKEKIIDDIFAKMSSKLPKGSEPLKRDKNCDDCGKVIEIFDEEN